MQSWMSALVLATKFDCPRQSQCAEEKVECKAFRFWVNNGEFDNLHEKNLKGCVHKCNEHLMHQLNDKIG